MTAHEFAEGLRQIAEWYDTNPDVVLPHLQQLDVFGVEHGSLSLAETVRRLGGTVEKTIVGDSGLFSFDRSFNGVKLRIFTDRAKVCTRRIVEAKWIPEKLVPEHTIPAHIEEVVEWDCHSVLAESA